MHCHRLHLHSQVGGCDIVEEMDASGELREIFSASASGLQAQEEESLEDRLQALTRQSDVVLFMKATPRLLLNPPCAHE